MILNKTLFSFLFLTFVTTVLLLQSQLPIYSTHLSTDIYVFYNRANYFITNHNLKHLDNNEYQPGTTLFFILLSLPFTNNSIDIYKAILFVVNILIFFILAYSYKRIAVENIALFTLFLLFTGPIILFRFDLLVSLLVVLSIILWNKNKYILAAILLGLATTIKIYPLIFLPYLLIISYKNAGFKFVFQIIAIFLITILTFTESYSLFFQTNLQQLLDGLNYHALKPVSTDNLYGLLIYFYNVYLLGHHPQIISAYGTNGLANKDILLPLWFYNYFWLIPFAALHITLLRRKIIDKKIDIIFFLTNLLIFLIFTKSIAPQYMIWLITLIPLIQPEIYLRKVWSIALILIFACLFFYQYTYPLNYNTWLNAFHPPYNFQGLMLISILRNIFLVIVAGGLVVSLLRNRVIRQSN